MMIRIFILLILFYTNLALSAGNNSFIDFFSSLESLRTEFTQNTYNDNNELISTTSGILTFKRPNQLLWHTLSPNEQILLLNNNQLWLIDVEIEQSNLLPLNIINQSPLYWLITKPQSLTNIPNFATLRAGINWYQTSQSSPQYRQLQFGFKDKTLYAISLKNPLDQKVVVVFDKLNINIEILSEVFEINTDPIL